MTICMLEKNKIKKCTVSVMWMCRGWCDSNLEKQKVTNAFSVIWYWIKIGGNLNGPKPP